MTNLHSAHNLYGDRDEQSFRSLPTSDKPGEWVVMERVRCACGTVAGYFVVQRVTLPAKGKR